MPKSIPVPPQRHRAAAFFNKNTRQVRGEERVHVCARARVSPQINANRKEPPGDANQGKEAARSRFRLPSRPPPTSAAASLLPASICLFPSFISPVFFPPTRAFKRDLCAAGKSRGRVTKAGRQSGRGLPGRGDVNFSP